MVQVPIRRKSVSKEGRKEGSQSTLSNRFLSLKAYETPSDHIDMWYRPKVVTPVLYSEFSISVLI